MSDEEIWFDEQLSRTVFLEIDGKRVPVVVLKNTRGQELLPSKLKIGPASEGIITETSIAQTKFNVNYEPKQETWRDRPPLL